MTPTLFWLNSAFPENSAGRRAVPVEARTFRVASDSAQAEWLRHERVAAVDQKRATEIAAEAEQALEIFNRIAAPGQELYGVFQAAARTNKGGTNVNEVRTQLYGSVRSGIRSPRHRPWRHCARSGNW